MKHGLTDDLLTTAALVKAIAAPAFLVSNEKRLVAINDAALSQLGIIAAQDVLGQDIAALICAEQVANVRAQTDRIEDGAAAIDIAILPMRCKADVKNFVATPIRAGPGPELAYLCQYSEADWRTEEFNAWATVSERASERTWVLDLNTGDVMAGPETSDDLPGISVCNLTDYLDLVHSEDALTLKSGLASLASGVSQSCTVSYRVQVHPDEFRFMRATAIAQTSGEDPRQTVINVTEADVTGIADIFDGPGGRQQSELNWKHSVLGAIEAVWDHDFEQDRHYLSAHWRKMRGLSENDPFPNRTEEWLATLHPHDLPHINEQLRRLDSGETDIIDYKFRQRHKDGHWIWIYSNGRVVRRDGQGFPARIVGTDIDITEIKTVELESLRMAQRLDVAMEAAGMGRWEFNVKTQKAYWDDRLLKMFGLKDGENLRAGDNWANYIHPDDREEMVAYTEYCLANKLDVARDYRLLTDSGDVRYVRTRGKFVDDAEKGPRYYGVNFDITQDKLRTQELEKARALLEHESRHDALTGLANRRRLDEVFFESTRDQRKRVAVLHFDIDHFKQINDTLGHAAGDSTLKHASSVLQRNTPETALVSRVGGDEFVALLFNAPDDAELEHIAQTIIRDMAQPYYYDSHECNIGTSIGVAVAHKADTTDTSLFINADLALYEAKKAGRGRFRFYCASMKEAARKRKNSFDALTAGFEKGEITCHYQPQFDAETLEVSGLEALVRWDSEQFGLMMPQEFLGTAEDMGLLPQFDDLVLRRALFDLKSWEAAGLRVPSISVNVSSHRLNDPTLQHKLAALDLPRGKISFELLESAFLDARDDVIDKNLKFINDLGIDIEIDDFGSGHASIVSLLEIAPKRLKIDRSLIKPIVQSHQQRELVKTIVGIGHMLGIRVVAEGVESDLHIKILQKMGCCFLQGFGLAKPMEASKVTAFLRAQPQGAHQSKQA